MKYELYLWLSKMKYELYLWLSKMNSLVGGIAYMDTTVIICMDKAELDSRSNNERYIIVNTFANVGAW